MLEGHYESFRAVYEERFESQYGFWRPVGSLVNWNPHFHLLVTDGGFLADGRFLKPPFHDAQVLAEAFRRTVLKRFVDKGLMGREAADGMLRWPHSGFEVNDEVVVAEADRAGHLRLARHCARNPVALERLGYKPALASRQLKGRVRAVALDHVRRPANAPSQPSAGPEKGPRSLPCWLPLPPNPLRNADRHPAPLRAAA